eukprot:gene8174-2828_t
MGVLRTAVQNDWEEGGTSRHATLKKSYPRSFLRECAELRQNILELVPKAAADSSSEGTGRDTNQEK